MNEIQNIIVEIRDAQLAYEKARKNNTGVTRARTILTNILQNRADALIAAIESVTEKEKAIVSMGEEIEFLNKSLADADHEYDELNKKYKALVEASAEKSGKKKAGGE